MKRSIQIAAIFLLAWSVPAHSDGKFYWNDRAPFWIPYQRGIILFDGKRETLLLQSKYEVPKKPRGGTMGWVVPVPTVPELASMDPDSALRLFLHLTRRSQPDVTRVSRVLLLIGGVLGLIVFVLTLFVCRRSPRTVTIRNVAVIFMILGLLATMLLFAPTLGVPRVEVVKGERVGIYDVRVIRSDQPRAIVEWLNANGFRFTEADTKAFAQYVQHGWCFVVAKLGPSADKQKHEITMEGLAAPLIMRFPTETPVYPLALTATTGRKTKVLLYVAAQRKVACDERMELQYAGELRSGMPMPAETDPEDFFSETDLALSFICRFQATLTPEQMQTDLTFRFAPDNEPHRHHVVRW